MSKQLNLHLKIWRQDGPMTPGSLQEYEAAGIPDDASFLEMLDVVNERLIEAGQVPIEFPHDCREGICGTCGVMVNGQAHGHQKNTAVCQLHMREFSDGDTIVIEPWRAAAFPCCGTSSWIDQPLIGSIESGGYTSASTGNARDANEILVPKEVADSQWTPPPASGVAHAWRPAPTRRRSCSPVAKLWHLNRCPRANPSGSSAPRTWWKPWKSSSVRAPTTASAPRPAPRGISQDFIAYMNRDYIKSKVYNRKLAGQ